MENENRLSRKGGVLRGLYLIGLLSVFLGVLSGCSQKGGDTSIVGEGGWEGEKSAFDVNLYAMHKTVCNPFSPEDPPQFDYGLKSTLFYLTEDVGPSTPLDEYFQKGHKSEQDLFFTRLNVPTRGFEQGFTTETGDAIKDDGGEILTEYFALHFETTLTLSPQQEPGFYEIALLSDDGARVVLKDSSGGSQNLIDHPELTPTKMMCSSHVFDFTQGQAYPLEIEYFQGPRRHIALVMMMRPVDEGAGSDPLCNRSGNNLFFAGDGDSEPLLAYEQLLTRGWVPASPSNFELPSKYVYNPCTTGDSPKILNFQVHYNGGSSATFTWETDMSATSQVQVTHVLTEEAFVTLSDNILRKSHSVTVEGLELFAHYQVRGISVSSNLGKAISPPKDLQTYEVGNPTF